LAEIHERFVDFAGFCEGGACCLCGAGALGAFDGQYFSLPL
jgi:hypothetical protein